MRERYPYCLLVGDNSPSFDELCRSLRFSTHCHYIILSPEPPFPMEPYVYMQWKSLNEFTVDALPADENILCIMCFGDELVFQELFSREELKTPIRTFRHAPHERNHAHRNITESLQPAYFNDYIPLIEDQLRELFSDKELDALSLDFMLGYAGELTFLGGAVTHSSQDGEHIRLIEDALHKEFQNRTMLIKGNAISKNHVVTLHIPNNHTNGFLPTLEINRMAPRWIYYRAAGINVPLILIQNLVRRKVKTYYFIDPKNIEHTDTSAKPTYTFHFDVVYFDLDETLVWKGAPLQEGIALLRAFHKQYPLKLITRHKPVIQDTLHSIGLDREIFDEIIPVPQGQKKSSFVTGRALFIDNEFPERLDVRLQCGIPVLNLDQLDFLHCRHFK